MAIVGAAWVPGLPHLLTEGKSPQWDQLSRAYKTLGEQIRNAKPDVIVLYSTQWISVLGTSFQAAANPQGLHVDENWYDLGDLPFNLKVDAKLGLALADAVKKSGLPTKAVDVEMFPIDTGTIVAQHFLNPKSEIPWALVSAWVYADATKAKQIGRVMREEVDRQGKKAYFIACSLLSTRYFTDDINPQEDKLTSPKDDEWNRKILGWLETGDFRRVEAEAANYTKEVGPDMQFNAFHWLNGVLEQTKAPGRVLAYGPIWGTGAAVVNFVPEVKK